jgi:hypothetical protein
LNKTAVEVEKQLTPQVQRLLSKPNVIVVFTDYYDPMNTKAKKFGAWPEGSSSLEWCGRCRPRWEEAITRLNEIFVNVRSNLKNPPRLALTGDLKPKGARPIERRFVGHEAPRPACGNADPGNDGTWIQENRDPKGRPDCVHPNVEGAVEIGRALNFEASKAGR